MSLCVAGVRASIVHASMHLLFYSPHTTQTSAHCGCCTADKWYVSFTGNYLTSMTGCFSNVGFVRYYCLPCTTHAHHALPSRNHPYHCCNRPSRLAFIKKLKPLLLPHPPPSKKNYKNQQTVKTLNCTNSKGAKNFEHDVSMPLSGMVSSWDGTRYDQPPHQIWSLYIHSLWRYERQCKM